MAKAQIKNAQEVTATAEGYATDKNFPVQQGEQPTTGLALAASGPIESGDIVAIESMSMESYQQTLAMLGGLKTMQAGPELTATYLKIEQGEEIRGIYIGVHKISSQYDGENGRTDENGEIETVKVMMVDEDNSGAPKFVIIGDVVVVGTLKTMPVKTAVSIACTGKERGKNGFYKKFSIRPLY